MQLSNAPSKLLLPFASAGGKNTVPVTPPSDAEPGSASLTEGFPSLTRTPIAAGGVPPSGLDMNGILFAISAIARWANAGGGFPYDAAFATDANVSGYPKGARVARSDGLGYWLNTVDGNTVDPESITVGQAASAGWVPDVSNGIAIVALSNANVTLSPLQYGLPVIVLTGVLAANLNLVFPSIQGEWVVVNNTTGAFAVTCKTSAGVGSAVAQGATVALVGDGVNLTPTGISQTSADARYAPILAAQQIKPVTASVAANALTVTLNATTLDFRSSLLTSGTVNTRTVAAPISLTVPSGATLGTIATVAARLVIIAIDNAGTVELAIANLAGGVNLDETGLISTTAISAAATSATAIYSQIARASVPYRIVGFIDITEAAAGTWATAPSTIQGKGGQALAALQSIGYGQTWVNVPRSSGVTYYNTTGRPILVKREIQTSSAVVTAASVNGTGVGTILGGYNAAGLQVFAGLFLVPPGASYSMTDSGTVNASATYELR